MTYSEIRELGLTEIRAAKDNFKTRVEKYLKENHLDQIVERVGDGRKGMLIIIQNVGETLGYELRFYPVTKRGFISQKASGYITWNEELTETYREVKQ